MSDDPLRLVHIIRWNSFFFRCVFSSIDCVIMEEDCFIKQCAMNTTRRLIPIKYYRIPFKIELISETDCSKWNLLITKY